MGFAVAPVGSVKHVDVWSRCGCCDLFSDFSGLVLAGVVYYEYVIGTLVLEFRQVFEELPNAIFFVVGWN
jgi:hypothetical protein